MVMLKQSKVRKSRRLQRKRRHLRVRKKIWGTAERPRLVLFRSARNTEGQLVDDDRGETLVGQSTLATAVQEADAGEGRRKEERAREAGRLLAERAKEKGIERALFDRGGYRYHGRVRAFAEGAREGGLEL